MEEISHQLIWEIFDCLHGFSTIPGGAGPSTEQAKEGGSCDELHL